MNAGPTTQERKSETPKKRRSDTPSCCSVAEFLVSDLREHRIHHQQQTECDRQRNRADPELVEAIVQTRDQRAETEASSHRKPDPERQEAVERGELREHGRVRRRRDCPQRRGSVSARPQRQQPSVSDLDRLVEQTADELVQLARAVRARAVAGARVRRSHRRSGPHPSAPSSAERRSPGRAAARRRSPRSSRTRGQAAPQDPDAGWVPERLREQASSLGQADCSTVAVIIAALVWRAPSAMPAGTPRSGFTAGSSCGQAQIVPPTRYPRASIRWSRHRPTPQ